MRKDTNAAQAIHSNASKHRYPELLIKKTGEALGPDAIRSLLPTLRTQGKIGLKRRNCTDLENNAVIVN